MFFVSVFFYRESEFLLAYSAAILHEAAHALACICLKIPLRGISVGISGVWLQTDYIQSSNKKLAVSLAGPLASLAVFLTAGILGRLFSLKSYFYSFFMFSNFFIGAINLLPITPLDGGSALKAALSKYLGIICAGKVYGIIAAFFYCFFAVFCLMLTTRHETNLSLCVVFLFITLNLKNEYLTLIFEKKLVLSGEVESHRKIRYIACDAESDALCLASRIGSEYTLVVASFSGDRFFGEVSQKEIINGIKKHGALCTVKECIIHLHD